MMKRAKEEANEDVLLSIKFVKVMKYIKAIIAFLLIAAYFYKSEYLLDLVVVGLSLSLIMPQGFMDTYLEKLSALRAAETDERQVLNATESNKHFSSAFEKIEKLKIKLSSLSD